MVTIRHEGDMNCPGQSEVCNLQRLSSEVNQHITRLQISMQNFTLMTVIDTTKKLMQKPLKRKIDKKEKKRRVP